MIIYILSMLSNLTELFDTIQYRKKQIEGKPTNK